MEPNIRKDTSHEDKRDAVRRELLKLIVKSEQQRRDQGKAPAK